MSVLMILFNTDPLSHHGVPVLPLQLMQALFSGEECCALMWCKSFTVLESAVGIVWCDAHHAKYSPLV